MVHCWCFAPLLLTQGTVIETSMMKRSWFSIRRQSILNAIFATRNCTLAQAWLFIACRWVHFPLLCFISFKRLWSRNIMALKVQLLVLFYKEGNACALHVMTIGTSSLCMCFRCTKRRLTVYQMPFREEQTLSWRSMVWRGFQRKTCRKGDEH